MAGVLKAFEIHTFHGGRWKIDSVFDDKELAVFEAKRMDSSGRYAGVRVVEEIFDESKQDTNSRTIFRGSRVAEANEKAIRDAAQTRNKAANDRQQRVAKNAVRRKAAQRKAKQAQTNPFRLIAILTVLVLVALGALYGLQHLNQTL